MVVEGATVDKPKVKVKKSSNSGTQQGSAPGTSEAAVSGGQNATEAVDGVPGYQVGSAVTVITRADLKARQVRHAADALRSLPGVAVSQTGSGGGLTQIRIRGAEGNHTLVLIDGIDVSETSANEFDWSNLLAEDIDRIEVIRGGHSGIYGSKAIGGVVNIITRGGRGPITLSARTEIGGYGTREVSARASGGTDRAWIAIAGNYREQNDFNWANFGTEDDPWRNSSFSVKGGLAPVAGMTVDFILRNTNKLTETDPEGLLPQTGLNGAFDAANYTDANHLLGGVNVRWDMLDGALTHIIKANRNETETDSFSAVFGTGSTNIGEADTLSYLATYRFATPGLLQSKHSVSGLVETKDETFTPISPFSDGRTRSREHLATLAEYRGGFYDRVFVTGTVRHDDNDTFADFTTWHTGLSVDLREIGVRPHASVGTSVALPGMFEQFGSILGTFIGNPNLVPEESFGWDAGVELTALRGRAVLDATYFEADLTNKIAGFGNTLVNLPGESTRKGIELSGRLEVLPGLWAGASYTYLDATDPSGAEEVRRPPHAGRADLTWAFDGGRGTLNLEAIYNGDMKDVNFVTFPATIVSLDEYWLVNAAASYQLKPGLEFFGRVENLLDERYEEISGYNTLGIAAYAGVRVTLEDSSTKSWSEGR